jgi:SAM-dependent methyltransferase
MDKLELLLSQILNENLTQIVISGPKKQQLSEGEGIIRKIQIRPVLLKGRVLFQTTSYTEKQAFHANKTKEETIEFICGTIQSYKQLQAYGNGIKADVLCGKKGNLSIKSEIRQASAKEENAIGFGNGLAHNREKEYILPKDCPVPFLIDLGVQTKEGKIIADKYDKFRQINRFLEFIRDILPSLPKGRQISILDFGCGKSYLTFAMYYYLKIMNGLDVDIIGLDLKEAVIQKCNQLKDAYGYENLHFLVGDISQYEGKSEVDMVVTLHACDTATDYALAKAVKWNAQVILSVPCCQHELNGQISQELLKPVLQYGLLKERISALLTDGIRASLLEEAGYDVQVLEFIDMEHTPKNILLRCVKNTHMRTKKENHLEEMLTFLHSEPMLKKLLEEHTC